MLKRRTSLALTILASLWLLYAGIAVSGIGWLGDIAAPFIGALATFFVFRCALVSVNYRVTWFVTALGLFFWTIADTLWAIYTLSLGLDPEKSIILPFIYLLTNVCFVFTVFYISLYNRRRWMAFQFLVDIIAIFCSVSALFFYVYYFNRYESLLSLGYVGVASFISLITDMLLITLPIAILLSLKIRKVPVFLRFMMAGFVAYAVSDILYINTIINDAYIPNGWNDALYMLSLALCGAGGVFFFDNPIDLGSIRKEVNTSIGIVYRSLFLLIIPLLAILLRQLRFSELMVFAVIIAVHQLCSRLIRQLLMREIEFDERGQRTEYLEATIADRTRELKIMNQTLENLLKRDAITGLYNRKYFLETAEEWIGKCDEEEKVWLLILDFDRFKTINDTYGHDVGDQVLRIIGKRLEGLANDRTVLARLGGDEFGFICRRRASETITAFLHTLSDITLAPVEVGLHAVHASLSIGVASWPDDAHTRSDLMRHADIAMYIAKNRRVSGVSFFDTEINATIERSHQIDLALKTADFDREFSLVYQPQFATGGRRLIGMEALVRWNSPSLGRISPDDFIPVAEENGVINPLSDWIFRKALSRIADWNRRYDRALLMGINVSPHQLDDADFLPKLEAMMEDCGVRPEWVNLEFTERVAMKSESFIIDVFTRLNKLNITSSIDDFGTGYSSLSYIKKFEFDYLKIAKQLVDGIVTNETDLRIVQAIIMMATALNLRTIAEGVESEEQLSILEGLGCDEIQGYLLGKPMSPDEFESLFINEEPELL